MRFDVGCNTKEFREYWSRNGYDGNLDHLMNVVAKDKSQLIVWRENGRIVGHAVWHESNTDEHRKGVPRDEEDREALENFLVGRRTLLSFMKSG